MIICELYVCDKILGITIDYLLYNTLNKWFWVGIRWYMVHVSCRYYYMGQLSRQHYHMDRV